MKMNRRVASTAPVWLFLPLVSARVWAADPALPPATASQPATATQATPAAKVGSGDSSTAAPNAQFAPDTGARLQSLGYRPSDIVLDGPPSKLQPSVVTSSGFTVSGPLPSLARGHFARFIDAINPFGSGTPAYARPNSALTIGNSPMPAGWRNEISHEPVGMTIISVGR